MLLLSLSCAPKENLGCYVGQGQSWCRIWESIGEPWRQNKLGLGEGLGETAWLRCLRSNGPCLIIQVWVSYLPRCYKEGCNPKTSSAVFSAWKPQQLPKNSKAKLKRFPDGSAEELSSTGTLGCRGRCPGEKPAHKQDLEVGNVFATCWSVSLWHGQQVQLEHPTEPMSKVGHGKPDFTESIGWKRPLR